MGKSHSEFKGTTGLVGYIEYSFDIWILEICSKYSNIWKRATVELSSVAYYKMGSFQLDNFRTSISGIQVLILRMKISRFQKV